MRAWAVALDPTAYVPISTGELERELLGQVDRLLDALDADPPVFAAAAKVGAWLVERRFVGPDSLPRTIETLDTALLSGRRGQTDRQRSGRVVALLAALAGGYASAMRMTTLDQQDQLNRALLTAKQRAEERLQVTESRFREVFTSSAAGIAITDPTGRFKQTNPALARILGCRPDELAGRRLRDFFADRTDDLALAGQLGAGRDRVRERRELIRGDGDTAWVYLVTSSLINGSRVAMVQDLTEIQLLHNRLEHQLTHDALTGLANRQLFISRLEHTLGQANPDASITLCCVGLDAFTLVNSGRGHETGDLLLQSVAKTLLLVVAGEHALVARIGGDEFAILIEDSDHTPDIPELVGHIHADLAEPIYLGGHGVAVGASIGAVRRTAGESSGDELFRAADLALRHAKAIGKRQWVEYDQHRDASARQTHRDAIEMAAGWEIGEVDVAYQPVVRLVDGRPVAAAAMLTWNRPDLAARLPDTDLELAEHIGLSVSMLPWMLLHACEQLATLRKLPGREATVPVLRICLTRLQSSDADLSAAVNQAIDASDVQPGQLEIAFDTGALLADHGDALDNLHVLSTIGTATALHGFTGGIAELSVLERLPARSVILANQYTQGAEPTGLGRLTAAAIGRLVADLRDGGFRVGVDGVRDAKEAAVWQSLGVQTASGPAFAGPATADELVERYMN
jgi:diguanylate cyclase (GGDEF)-like protein/PAS domain S-box-containing protein